MNYYGMASGIILIVIIAVLHKLVVWGYYHFGKKICVLAFAVTGLVCVIASLFTDSIFLSVILAMFGFSVFWGVKEVFEQEKRVKKGWFPGKG